MSKIIISAPLDIPKVEPDDWNEWWDVWNQQSNHPEKIKQTHNDLQSPWIGFDIFVKPGKELTASSVYNFKNINRPDLFSKFFNNLEDFPLDIDVMRAASSFCPVIPHSDFTEPTYSVRSMLYDDNLVQTWYYVHDKRVRPLLLPKDTNSWIYPDHESKHGSMYNKNHKKILIIYYGTIKENILEQTLEKSKLKYQDYIIYK